jgi:phosphate transport system substrate-binding protein
MLCVVALCGFLAVGTDDNADPDAVPPNAQCAPGSLRMGGSTFVQTLVQQWIKQYGSVCSDARVDFQAIGSGAGVQQFTNGTIDMGATDVRLTSSEEASAVAKRGQVLQVPWVAGGIAVMYNIDGLPRLQLSPRTLAGLFAGTITRWDDAAVAADNPGVRLPSLAVQIVHRSDGSGTTAAFTSFLSAVAPDVWRAGSAKDVKWPTGQGAKGSDGVTALVKTQQGTLAYAETSFAQVNNLGVAAIRNAAGNYTQPDAPSVTAALESASVDAKLKVVVDYASPAPAMYPIAIVSYAVVPMHTTALGHAFLDYAVGDGQREAERLFYAPLPAPIVSADRAALQTLVIS